MKKSKEKYLETIASLLPEVTVLSGNVNHLDKLKAAYTSGGLPAIEEYTNKVQRIFEATLIKQVSEVNGQDD